MAITIHDLLPTSANKGGVSPYEARTGKKPTIEHIRSFGAPCVVKDFVTPEKGDNHGRKGTYCGWHKDSQSHLVWLEPRVHEPAKLEAIKEI